MRLLVLLTSTFPYGGGEDFLATEVRYISGFDRVLICPCNRKPGSGITKRVPEGIRVVPLQRREAGKTAYAGLLLRPYVLREAARLLRGGRRFPQRLHEMLFFMKNAAEIHEALRAIPEFREAGELTIYSYWFYDAAAAAALLAGEWKKRGKRVRFISRAHGFDIYPERARYGYLPMRPFLLDRVDRLYPCSPQGARAICSRYPEYAGKVRPALLGTEDRGVAGGRREPEFHLVSCSYMVPVKRLHLIVEALRLSDFPIRWTHLGSGPLEEELRRRAGDLPAHIRAEFPGAMSNEEVLRYYRGHAVSAFVNVSASEGIPVSVMEAISFGLPVLATDVGGNAEAVRDGETGYLLKKNFEPAALMEKIRLLRDLPREQYDRLCAGARSLWERKFSARENYGKFYEEISR